MEEWLKGLLLKLNMLIKAEKNYIRMSPQKLRLVVDVVKKLNPVESLDYLKFLNKRAARPLAETIKQAIANAVNNKKADKKKLKFAYIDVMEGPTYKRWRPVSRGRAHSILKRTSHIKVVLEAEDGSKS
jgi:large subunit ribosomal protein L22